MGIARITTQVRRRIIRRGPAGAPGEFCAAVRGAIMGTACAAPLAATTFRLSRASLLDFVAASSFPFPLLLCVFTFMHLCICQRSSGIRRICAMRRHRWPWQKTFNRTSVELKLDNTARINTGFLKRNWCRIRRLHYCNPLSSEPCLRVAPHTAQANHFRCIISDD